VGPSEAAETCLWVMVTRSQ